MTASNDEKFKVGDKVWSPHFGGGIVTNIFNATNIPYPVKVKWIGAVSRSLPEEDYFTKDGQFDFSDANPDFAIYSLEADHGKDVMADVVNAFTKTHKAEEEKDNMPLEVIDLSDLFGTAEDSGVADRMMDALDKKTDDAINPSHYQVKGLPEAIDIINHLMHREQYEGFLWGNILKYAYRFGRKGDKAETAGKIAWYAKELKELEECEGE